MHIFVKTEVTLKVTTSDTIEIEKAKIKIQEEFLQTKNDLHLLHGKQLVQW